ncbi:hypothetical protein BV20DRAFT_86622 [Pilatotrama ljubarskyi]|nr:hypothetical protein BV20DRAFT_86622 [Pilatotrama ljubarskyi]
MVTNPTSTEPTTTASTTVSPATISTHSSDVILPSTISVAASSTASHNATSLPAPTIHTVATSPTPAVEHTTRGAGGTSGFAQSSTTSPPTFAGNGTQASPSSVPTAPSPSHDLSTGALAGIMVASALAALAILMALLLWKRRRLSPDIRHTTLVAHAPCENHPSMTPRVRQIPGKTMLVAQGSRTSGTSPSELTSAAGLGVHVRTSSDSAAPFSSAATAASMSSLHNAPALYDNPLLSPSPVAVPSSKDSTSAPAPEGSDITPSPSPDPGLSSRWYPSPLSQSLLGIESVRTSDVSGIQAQLVPAAVENGLTQEVDGGVRLAGGPPEDAPDTVPPPYCVY